MNEIKKNLKYLQLSLRYPRNTGIELLVEITIVPFMSVLDVLSVDCNLHLYL
jgi:hypothetical protein